MGSGSDAEGEESVSVGERVGSGSECYGVCMRLIGLGALGNVCRVCEGCRGCV